jgi:hypothetical protein
MRTSSPPASRGSSGSIRAPIRGRIKGTALRTGLLWYAQRYGSSIVARVVEDNASAELRQMIRLDDPAFGIVASGWYDTIRVGELMVLLERAAEIEDDGASDAYNNSLAGAIAKDNVYGVYRSLFTLITTPPMLVANGHRVWRTYVDEGTFSATTPRPGELVFEIRGWIHHHPQVCRFVGYITQQVLRIIGYEGLVMERTACISQGDPCCAFEGMYLPK